MYILKNSWKNIIRNKIRNILIGIIIIVIASVSTISLAIKNTSNYLINSYEDAYPKEATISFNRASIRGEHNLDEEGMEDMKEAISNVSELKLDDVLNYGDSKYLNGYYYTYSIGINGSDNIEKASSNFSFDRGGGKAISKNNIGMESSDFTLIGYSDIDSMQDFINGKYKLNDISSDAWDKIFDGNYIFINDELAELNGVEIGSVITLTYDDNEYDFEVIGIFEENSDTSNEISMFSNSANTIITNVDSVKSIVEDNEDISATINPTFILKSYDNVSLFEEELKSKGLSEYYIVSTNQEEVENATTSISNVSTFANTFLILTIIIGVVVLFIINQINIRERKYEIGVLRTIGMKKTLLTLQFMCELLIITVISLIIGLGIGASVAKPVSNMLLKNEIETSQEQLEDLNNNFGGHLDNMKDKNTQGINNNSIKGIINIQAYDSIDAVVDIKVILELFGIGIVLTMISSISSMISIQRFTPLQILKERS